MPFPARKADKSFASAQEIAWMSAQASQEVPRTQNC